MPRGGAGAASLDALRGEPPDERLRQDLPEWHTIEGPFVRPHDGRYYCFYSGSNYQTANYGVDYVVAGSVMGPYLRAGSEARVLKGIPGEGARARASLNRRRA